MTQPNICQRCGATLKPNDRFCRACGTTVAEARETNPAPTVKRRLSWKIWAGLGVLVLLLITMATLMIIDMRLFFKVASLFGIFLLLFSVAIMLLTFRKAKKVSPISLSIAIVTSLVCLVIYSYLLNVKISAGILMFTMLCGGMIGVGWSLASTISLEKGIVKYKGNIWHLAVWGMVFILNQLVTIITGRPPQIAILMLIASTGLVMGNSGSTLARFYHVRKKVPVTTNIKE